MRRPDMAELDAMTSLAGSWLRRCAGQPPAGVVVNRYALRAVLAASDNVRTATDNVITWSAGGREFSAEPILDSQL